jgi:uncharacterized alkaline shock family protein YloU
VTEFMAENQQAPNGPAPFAPRPDGAHLAPSAEPGAGSAGSAGLRGPGTGGGAGAPDAGARTGGPRFAPERGAEATRAGRDQGRAGSEVKGRIHIADEVVEKVAGLAAIEVDGVADVGGDFERAIESVRERIGLGNKRGDQGIKADVKGHEVAISVTIMVEFGHVVLDVARQVQVNVAQKTQRMLGLRVVEVNVTVDDVRTARPEEPAEQDVVAG